MVAWLVALMWLLAASPQATLPTGVGHWRDAQRIRSGDRTTWPFLTGASTDFAQMSVSAVRLPTGTALDRDDQPAGSRNWSS